MALSIIFILVTLSLYAYSAFSADQAGMDNLTSVTTLVALLVCLAPTTIGALLSAIGIAGMSRLNQANVLAMSGRAIEAAGTWTSSCWTKPEPSPWATARPAFHPCGRRLCKRTGRRRTAVLSGGRDARRAEAW